MFRPWLVHLASALRRRHCVRWQSESQRWVPGKHDASRPTLPDPPRFRLEMVAKCGGAPAMALPSSSSDHVGVAAAGARPTRDDRSIQGRAAEGLLAVPKKTDVPPPPPGGTRCPKRHPRPQRGVVGRPLVLGTPLAVAPEALRRLAVDIAAEPLTRQMEDSEDVCACAGHCYTPRHRYRHGCDSRCLVVGSQYCSACCCVVVGCERPRLRGPSGRRRCFQRAYAAHRCYTELREGVASLRPLRLSRPLSQHARRLGQRFFVLLAAGAHRHPDLGRQRHDWTWWLRL